MNLQDTAELAGQVVYEYPDWTGEHVMEMIESYKYVGEKAPCTESELYDACNAVQRLKSNGLSFSDAVNECVRTVKEWSFDY